MLKAFVLVAFATVPCTAALASTRSPHVCTAPGSMTRHRHRPPRMVPYVDPSMSEGSLWLQAFAPYAAIAGLKISIALTAEDPTKRANPQQIAVWVALSGGLYAAIVYRTLHPVGSEALAALSDAIVPPASAAELFGDAAMEGEIGVRPTIGGVNIFVFLVLARLAIALRGGNKSVALINGTRTVDGQTADTVFGRSLEETLKAVRAAAQGNSTLER